MTKETDDFSNAKLPLVRGAHEPNSVGRIPSRLGDAAFVDAEIELAKFREKELIRARTAFYERYAHISQMLKECWRQIENVKKKNSKKWGRGILTKQSFLTDFEDLFPEFEALPLVIDVVFAGDEPNMKMWKDSVLGLKLLYDQCVNGVNEIFSEDAASDHP
jgi:hypothetical protein